MWMLYFITTLGCQSLSVKTSSSDTDVGSLSPGTDSGTQDSSGTTDTEDTDPTTDTQPTQDPDQDQDGAPASIDCDDDNARAYPGNTEICDGIDNNCDNHIDEGLEQTWYWDMDGDGYGINLTVEDCQQPKGYAAQPGDCNDLESTIHPGATETCNTLDDDCNGTADDAGVCPCDTDHYPDSEHPYLYCQSAVTWEAAQADCETHGYALVTFDSQAELDHVTSVAGSLASNYWWLGFTDVSSEGSWEWIDGSPTSYQNWCSSEPNNDHGRECVDVGEEDCAMLNWGNGGCWNDYPCTCDWPYYICEGLSEDRPDDD